MCESDGNDVRPMLSPKEVARRLGVRVHTVQTWLRTGQLRGMHVGRLWRVNPADLDAFTGNNTSKHEMPSKVEMRKRAEAARKRMGFAV